MRMLETFIAASRSPDPLYVAPCIEPEACLPEGLDRLTVLRQDFSAHFTYVRVVPGQPSVSAQQQSRAITPAVLIGHQVNRHSAMRAVAIISQNAHRTARALADQQRAVGVRNDAVEPSVMVRARNRSRVVRMLAGTRV